VRTSYDHTPDESGGDGQASGPRDERPTTVLTDVRNGMRERDNGALWDHLNEKLNRAGIGAVEDGAA
jgi:hypothetical protein